MKVVFLDFDGPLIPALCWQDPAPDGKRLPVWDPSVLALNRITATTGAVIVVSSTWRVDGIARTRERLKEWGVVAECVALTPYCNERSSGGLFLGVPRGREIQKFLDEWGREDIESFVILDDDDDMEHLAHRLIQTPFEVGLTEADADRAIAMLNDFTGPSGPQEES